MTMNADFRITVRFLQPFSHGRGDDGLPEWPPSPLRLFQALVASSIGRQPDGEKRRRAVDALRWLEMQTPPEVLAPSATLATPYRLFVPDNVGDKVAKSWTAGRDASIADYRTEKDARPVRLDGEAVHFVFRHAAALGDHLSTLQWMARSLTHVGWGVDMVVGDASASVDDLEGERWIPQRHGGRVLRVPMVGTLDALEEKHERFLSRLVGDTFRPVPPLSTFRSTPYGRASDVPRKPQAAFRLLQPITADRLWLDVARRARDVAAWTRHAVGEACRDWPYGSIRTLVHGHSKDRAGRSDGGPRFSFVPLPSINPKLSRVEGIARVMIVAPPGYDRQLAWIQARLAGCDLVWQGETVAFLDPLPADDWVVRQYIEPSDCWSTVTPVVFPGHDDKSQRKGEKLLRRALSQAGFEPEVISSLRALEWRRVGFRKGNDHAGRYLLPDKVTGPTYHVRIVFAKPVPGPIAIGSGRYRGMGVFARE